MRDWVKTEAAAAGDPSLAEFLKTYQDPNCFLDWGDDPSFFAAAELFGDPRHASWGVCRRDVRLVLQPGDFVVWFCARQRSELRDHWSYFFVGISTVLWSVSRATLWRDPRYASYTRFYNTLARPVHGHLVQHEVFHRHHADWKKRASAPYIIFDPHPGKSALNLTTPLLVAEKEAGALLETWYSGRRRVARVERLLFRDLGIVRRLRIRNRQRVHRHIALHKSDKLKSENARDTLRRLRSALIQLVH